MNVGNLKFDRQTLYKAMLTRDKRFDGRFYVGVRTTGIYCRPICPARPKAKNVDFYRSASEAEAKGFRPCLRCRPDLSPASPLFAGTAAVVGRALRMIQEGEGENLEELATRLGITGRHLRRLFAEHIGASPAEVSASKRLHHARLLLSQTPMPITEVAFASGFRSLRRFNDAFKKTYKNTPHNFRREGSRAAKKEGLTLELPLIEPFEWGYLHSFLRAHSIEGLERFTDNSYERLLGENARLAVRAQGKTLLVTLEGVPPAEIRPLLSRLRHLFDIDHNPAYLTRDLGGIRVPGAFNGFETAVFIILGQMVSVAAARGKMEKLMRLYGEPCASPWPELNRLFPSPARLATVDTAELGRALGITRVRANAVLSLAQAVHRQDLHLSPSAPLGATRAKLAELSGIGPWTVEMIAMRCLADPDAFPEKDLIVLRAVKLLKISHERWKPYRAYLSLWIWKNYAHQLSGAKRKGKK